MIRTIDVSTLAIQQQALPRQPTLAKTLALVLVIWVLVWASLVNGGLAVYWVFGLAFGVILQRSRLCFASAFRDLFLMRDGRNLRAILVGLAVASVGFALIEERAVPTPGFGALPDQAHLMPASVQLIVGGLLFGLGMVLAGGCVSGTLYRIGEGYVGSLVALAGILLGLVVATQHWNWWWTTFSQHAPMIWLPGLLGYGGAVVVTVGVLGGLYLLSLWWDLRSGPRPALPTRRAAEGPVLSLRDWVSRWYRTVFGTGWPFTIGVVALAILNIFVFLFDHPLGVTGELSNWANRVAALGGIIAPPLLGASNLAGCLLVYNPTASPVSTGTMLDGGLIIGSFVAALHANEFKLRLPRQPVRYAQSLAGGVLMGYGAGIAAGCTIGAFFSAIPSLGLNGWIFGVGLLGGAGLGVQIIKRL
ncbi:MAG: YeeE/YedE family protein [Chloroflexi bacterium]|nr:YeeE/YedE family protein [Chloroflexota bacterium]